MHEQTSLESHSGRARHRCTSSDEPASLVKPPSSGRMISEVGGGSTGSGSTTMRRLIWQYSLPTLQAWLPHPKVAASSFAAASLGPASEAASSTPASLASLSASAVPESAASEAEASPGEAASSAVASATAPSSVPGDEPSP